MSYYDFWSIVEFLNKISSLLIAIFTALMAVFTALIRRIYKKMILPEVFAHLIVEQGELRGIRVENAGGGVAWEGTINCNAMPSGKSLSQPYRFTRLYPMVLVTIQMEKNGFHLVK